MWRVALSTVAILADVLIVLLAGMGFSEGSAPAGAMSASHAAATSAGPGTATTMGFALGLFALNILAILFGARLKLPGNRLKATTAVFE